MDFLLFLPDEISIKILLLLDLHDILSCQAVCRAWYDLVNDNAVWKTFLDDSFPLKDRRTDLPRMRGIPCKWKIYFMNHMRVIKNWRKDIYKQHKVNGKFRISGDVTLCVTAYDGKTLVIKDESGFHVYKIDRGNLIHVQKLSYKNYYAFKCVTNTNYIAANFGPFVSIYQLENHEYRLSHMLYTQEMNPKLICVQQQSDGIHQMDEMKHGFRINPYSETMCIIEDTLFFYMPHVKVLYAWNMKESRTLMEVNLEITYWNNDKTKVYICCNNVINVYDQLGRMCFCVKTNRNVSRILVNQNIFLAVVDARPVEKEIHSWDKVTGKDLMTKNLKIFYDCILHPKENILFYVNGSWVLGRPEIFALDLKEDVILWNTLISGRHLICNLQSIVADKFLLFYTSDVYKLLDTKNGQCLYSLDGIEDYHVFASYDVQIYNDNKNVRMIIKIYS